MIAPCASTARSCHTRSADEAARIAPGAGGPGDPYAYEAVGSFVVAWRGEPGDPHLQAVERCLR
jgi:hypothetical protein